MGVLRPTEGDRCRDDLRRQAGVAPAREAGVQLGLPDALYFARFAATAAHISPTFLKEWISFEVKTILKCFSTAATI